MIHKPNSVQSCAVLRTAFLAAASLGLVSQIVHDRHAITALSVFPQWLLIGAIWYAWRADGSDQDKFAHGAALIAVLAPLLSCLALLFAWSGWKANNLAICGTIPISDSASYYISAHTFLRDATLDAAGQRRPLNIAVTSLWALLSGDDYKVMLLIQALAFSAAAFLASVTVAALHGRRAALLLFALLLVFAEPYLPTMLSETNGIIFGTLACVGLILGLYRGSLFSYCFGALFLAIGLAIRPSALFVLPGVVVAGSAIFGSSRVRRLLVAGCLCAIVLLPSAVSVLMNKTMSHGDGALNGNLSYTVYGLVTGGKGWEQYDKDNPAKLKALPEGERSAIILEASRRYFEEHPIDLFRGLAEAQLRGPLQTFAQIVRLAFLGAAGDPLRIIRPAAIAAISLLFAGVLLCQWSARKRTAPPSGGLRLFWVSISIGYLISIPFFYKDGGLRVHAVMLPMLSYMLLRALLPSASTDASAGAKADRVLKANAIFGAALILLAAWIAAMHPSSRNFQVVAATDGGKDNEVLFQYKSGWPQCDLHRFDHAAHDNRRRWFSGAIPDDDYRSAGIKEISGTGRLYFGFDASSRDWKIIHTEVPVGPLNIVRMGSTARFEYGDDKYRDYYSATNVQIVSPDQAR